MNLARLRVLCVGTDPTLLKTRQVLLASRGYACTLAYPHEVEERLSSERFDLAILSVALGRQRQEQIRTILPQGTRALLLTHFVNPQELLDMVAEAAGGEAD
jgi:CheY-like chemotaxis protein